MAALTAGLFLGPPCKKLRNLVHETAGSAASRVLGSQMSFRPLIHFMVGRPPAAALWHWDPNTFFSDLCQAALKSTIAPGLTKLSDNRRSPCWLPALEGQARWLCILYAPPALLPSASCVVPGPGILSFTMLLCLHLSSQSGKSQVLQFCIDNIESEMLPRMARALWPGLQSMTYGFAHPSSGLHAVQPNSLPPS